MSYDAVGNVVEAVKPLGTATVEDLTDGTATYAYDAANRLTGTSFSTGVTAAYSYNAAGELTTVTPSGLGNLDAVEYGYDPTGRVSTVTRAGQIMPTTTAVGYDAAGQLSSLQHATGASVVDDYAVTRDVLGNPTELTTTTATSTTTSLYSFDAASRLRSECYPTTGETCTNRSPRVTYRYDKVGNRVTQLDRTVSGNKATTVKTASVYDAGDQLVSQSIGGVDTVNNTWSPNGELATSTTSAGTSTFTNDLTGELVSAALADGTTVDYTHDVTGNRTSRTIDGVLDVTWVWDNSSGLPVRIGEYDQNNELATVWLPDPTSPTGAPLAATTGTVSSWLLSDPFANLTTTIDTAASAVSGTRTMSVFGAELAPATGAMADSQFGFAGQYLDSTTGLYDMRARDYNSTTGRFTANDPIDVTTGTPFFAGYSYAHNNSLMFNDASGLEPRAWGDGRLSGVPGSNSSKFGGSLKNQTPNTLPGAFRDAVDYGCTTMTQWMRSDEAQSILTQGTVNSWTFNEVLSAGIGFDGADWGDPKKYWSGASLALSLATIEGANAVSAAQTLVEMFQTDGHWDLKVPLREAYGFNISEADSDPSWGYLTMSSGGSLYYDAIGNFQYGVMMHDFGVSLDVALAASRTGSAGNPDPSDDTPIALGYGFRNTYPGGFNSQNMYDFLTRPSSLAALEAAGKYRSPNG